MNGIIYTNGEDFVIHKDYIKDFLKNGENTINNDAEFYNYVVESNKYILEQVVDMKDEYIGLSIHPMDNWFYINQNLLKEI